MYMSNGCVVSGFCKNKQAGMLDCIATIYCYIYLHSIMLVITILPFNLISPISSEKYREVYHD